jgi:phage terminase large subunit
MARDLTAYAADPVGFTREVLRGRPWSKQVEILESVRDNPRTSVRACHGVGKSWVAAATCLWFLHTREPAIVLTTAPSRRQVKQVLWREIRRAQRAAGLPGEVGEVSIELSEETFALGLATNEPERFQGFHGENLLIVVDEASGVAEEIFEAMEGAMTSGHARLLLIGNPTRVAGQFYESHHTDPAYTRIHIGAEMSPNF